MGKGQLPRVRSAGLSEGGVSRSPPRSTLPLPAGLLQTHPPFTVSLHTLSLPAPLAEGLGTQRGVPELRPGLHGSKRTAAFSAHGPPCPSPHPPPHDARTGVEAYVEALCKVVGKRVHAAL